MAEDKNEYQLAFDILITSIGFANVARLVKFCKNNNLEISKGTINNIAGGVVKSDNPNLKTIQTLLEALTTKIEENRAKQNEYRQDKIGPDELMKLLGYPAWQDLETDNLEHKPKADSNKERVTAMDEKAAKTEMSLSAGPILETRDLRRLKDRPEAMDAKDMLIVARTLSYLIREPSFFMERIESEKITRCVMPYVPIYGETSPHPSLV